MFKWFKKKRELKRAFENSDKISEILIKDLKIEDGEMKAKFKLSIEALGLLAKVFQPLVDHVDNYLSVEFNALDGSSPIEISVRRVTGETPSVQNMRLKKEIEEWRSRTEAAERELEKVREQITLLHADAEISAEVHEAPPHSYMSGKRDGLEAAYNAISSQTIEDMLTNPPPANDLLRSIMNKK